MGNGMPDYRLETRYIHLACIAGDPLDEFLCVLLPRIVNSFKGARPQDFTPLLIAHVILNLINDEIDPFIPGEYDPYCELTRLQTSEGKD